MVKNQIEIKGDIALIHISREGKTVFGIIDKEDVEILKDLKNKLTLDTSGAIQHRTKENGVWTVDQLHRLIVGDCERFEVHHKNKNKLDCRKQNLKLIPRKLNKYKTYNS